MLMGIVICPILHLLPCPALELLTKETSENVTEKGRNHLIVITGT